jgi:hypothetical protein
MQDSMQIFLKFQLLASCFVLANVGCSFSLESKVVGTVTYAGKPVPNAIVSFQGKSGGPGTYAMTNEEGEYSLRTGSNQGVIVGTYRACAYHHLRASSCQ